MKRRDVTEDFIAMLALLAIVLLSVTDHISEQAVVALISAILGYVFGRRNGRKEVDRDEGTRLPPTPRTGDEHPGGHP